ncbi:MAG TPA: SpoIID/LytB domain-containing protein [Gemmatimonadales bacterium]|nr:SpoIID/LytB domain-containing protein [Gemmatimonadales bacterium]
MTRRLLAAALLLAACGSPAPPVPPPEPATVPDSPPDRPPDSATVRPSDRPADRPTDRSSGPLIRIALARSAADARVSGTAGLVVTDPSGAVVARAEAGTEVRLGRDGRLVAVRQGSRLLARDERLAVAPAEGGALVVDGKRYRGSVDALAENGGVTLVNALALEAYLPSVVTAELGRRTGAEREAVLAQAIIARTYALRNQGRGRAAGYDLESGVGDQVYGGADAEDSLATEAVRATAGVIVAWQGQPIDAFFHSTCGGRTERGVDVFRGADRPYLRSFADVDGDGLAWCRLSPRFRWREEWTGVELERVLRETLPAAGTRLPEGAGRLRDVRVTERTGSGRAAALAIRWEHADVSVSGQDVRRVLRPPAGGWLRSAQVEFRTERGGRLERLIAEGAGAGHGVGLCQWGAIGRARAGQRHDAILAAYYPGTTLIRFY